MEELPTRPAERPAPRWKALPAKQRRVLGVLVEKAKTTPEAYPMSVNAVRTGCNQKNNRHPLMELEQEDIEEALEGLRGAGAVAEVQGGSRVLRYRHYAYDWFGVDKFELAIMTELLLRGAQTEGELRGRAARMEPIADVSALRPMLNSLKAKNLIVSLTSEGRGHVLTHNLYEPRELEKLQREHAGGGMPTSTTLSSSLSSAVSPASQAYESPTAPAVSPVAAHASHAPAAQAVAPSAAASASGSSSRPAADSPAAQVPAQVWEAMNHAFMQLRSEVDDLRSQLDKVRSDLADLWSNFR